MEATTEITEDQQTRWVPLDAVTLDPDNVREHPEENIADIANSLRRFGQQKPIVVDRRGVVRAGNGTVVAARTLGWTRVLARYTELDGADATAYAIADNRTAETSRWNDSKLFAQLEALHGTDPDAATATGFSHEHFAALQEALTTGGAAPGSTTPGEKRAGSLAERFGVPPLSVLDSRAGYWQARKAAWRQLGLRSELGRDRNLTLRSPHVADPGFYAKKQRVERLLGRTMSSDEFIAHFYRDGAGEVSYGTSAFDPVIAELCYRWFCPPGGSILDPFAGGATRGVVAAALRRPYTGIDLRAEQVNANVFQWAETSLRLEPIAVADVSDVPARGPAGDDEQTVSDPTGLTPVEVRDGVYVKRDDLFEVAGVRGGKVRSCWALAQGAEGLVTAGSRSSPQVNIVAHVARALGLPCRVHTPTGELSPEVAEAAALGAEVVQHRAGYNNVIIARARKDARDRGWREIPFGMECAEAVKQTRGQVANVPDDVGRIVVPVGSGMSLAGILHGLADAGRSVHVVGVVVGADPSKRLDKYAPADWRQRVELVPAGVDYHTEVSGELAGLALDPVYEAKCLPFLRAGDLLWVVGRRATLRPAATPAAPSCVGFPAPRWVVGDSRDMADLLVPEDRFDFVFSCPPYADLERYSDDPRDLSTMDYPAFVEAYGQIIRAAVDRLRADRFIAWVVGEVRGPDGAMRGLVADTVRLFQQAGAAFWNEAILVQPVGSRSIVATRQFGGRRKMGKVHQQVLIFVKGDVERAVAAIGHVDFAQPEVTPTAEGESEAVETEEANDGGQ
ncbi:MAG: pyridoxal-phosphate dependent enzyme [Armatimonadota bacterium]|nr:pyridoxal-phosphate dependent enzyme [Armatimonadota bacterium]